MTTRAKRKDGTIVEYTPTPINVSEHSLHEGQNAVYKTKRNQAPDSYDLSDPSVIHGESSNTNTKRVDV